jgi:TRAP-type C4-dicarboxylate transport system substrate-binding protein
MAIWRPNSIAAHATPEGGTDMRHGICIAALLAIAAPAAPHAAEPITLKLGFPPPPGSNFNGGALLPWSQEIEKATGGEVKIQIYPGSVLADHRNAYDRVLNGVADIVFGLHGILGKTFQKSTVTGLPGFVATGEQCAAALWQLYASGVIADEYEKVRPLGFACFPPTSIVSHKPLRSLDDIKGMKISVNSRLYGQAVEILGGAPITLATTELYQGLQRGTVDAAMVGLAAVAAYKLQEVASYFFEAPFGQTTEYLLMNKQSYAKLPTAARQAFDRTTGAPMSARLSKAAKEENEMGVRLVEGVPGKTVTKIGADLPRLRTAMRPLIDQWLKDTPDGARVLEAYKAELAKSTAMK